MDSFYSKLNEIENNFDKVCDEYVFSALSQFKDRQLKGVSLIFLVIVSIIADIVLFVKNANDIVLIVATFVAIALSFILYQYILDFKTKIKQKCFPKMINTFENLNYMESFMDTEVMPDSRLRKSGIFTQNADYNSRMCDDCFSGSFGNTNFKVCELELIKSGGKSSATIFKGIALEFDLKNQILNPIRVLTKAANSAVNAQFMFIVSIVSILTIIMAVLTGFFIYTSIDIGKNLGQMDFLTIFLNSTNVFMMLALFVLMAICIYSIVKWQKDKNNIPKLILDDTYIGKKYVIYSKDKNEAYNLITPEFIELFEDIQKIFKTKNVKCAFFDKTLMFAVSTSKDWFELGGIFGKLNDKNRCKEFFTIFSLICKIANYLNK